MNNLTLVLTSKLKPFTDIFIDGNIVKPKKIKGKYTIQYSTENTTVELGIKRYSFFQTWWCYLFDLIFFVFSFFGIFDSYFARHCYRTYCKIKLDVQEQTFVKLKVLPPKKNKAVAIIESQLNYEQIENIYLIDKTARRRKIILIFLKLFTFIASIVALILLLIFI